MEVSTSNGRFRDECLNEHLLGSLTAARLIIEASRVDDNIGRSHTSLDGLTLATFATGPTRGIRKRTLVMSDGTSEEQSDRVETA